MVKTLKWYHLLAKKPEESGKNYLVASVDSNGVMYDILNWHEEGEKIYTTADREKDEETISVESQLFHICFPTTNAQNGFYKEDDFGSERLYYNEKSSVYWAMLD